jgi:hypothetical protein
MAVHFVNEAYKHCKALAATGVGSELLPTAEGSPVTTDGGRARAGDGKPGPPASDPALSAGGDGQVAKVVAAFIKAIAQHRDWSRETRAQQVAAGAGLRTRRHFCGVTLRGHSAGRVGGLGACAAAACLAFVM